MKNVLLFFLLFLISVAGSSQGLENAYRGKWELISFGGGSLPFGNYKGEVGKAKNGAMLGISADKYFKENKFALGLDIRVFNHDMCTCGDIYFTNGSLVAKYDNPTRFRGLNLMFGPTYKYAMYDFSIEAFVKGGAMFQEFPQYSHVLTVNNQVQLLPEQTNNPTNKPSSLVGNAGLRFSYQISPIVGLFLQTDYMNTFGSKLGNDNGKFLYKKYRQIKDITENTTLSVNGGAPNLNEYFDSNPLNLKTNIKAFNVLAGVKFVLSRSKKADEEEIPLVSKTTDPIKDILVVVKDKQTGLPIENVMVYLKSSAGTLTFLTDVNGEIPTIRNAKKSDYYISGTKNDISTTTATITAADFDDDKELIYRELLHNDPRFTLIGETVSQKDGSKLPNINTILTNITASTTKTKVSDADARFAYQLAQESDYSVVAHQAGKFSQTEKVSTKGLDRSETFYVKLKLPVDDIETGKTFVLKDIHYDFDKSHIRSDAALILDNVVHIMEENPSLKIELSSHTDCRGSNAYNMILSENRAKSAVAYIVGKGIEQNRLVAKGYGETKLLNSCSDGKRCPEPEHQRNRRTELKVLSISDNR